MPSPAARGQAIFLGATEPRAARPEGFPPHEELHPSPTSWSMVKNITLSFNVALAVKKITGTKIRMISAHLSQDQLVAPGSIAIVCTHGKADAMPRAQ
jgi:hypothetical protein